MKEIEARPHAMGWRTRAAVNPFETMSVRSSSWLVCKKMRKYQVEEKRMLDAQSMRGGGIKLVTEFGGGTGRFRLRTRSKQANDEK